MSKTKLLIEIGTEEIPARHLPDIKRQLDESVPVILNKNSLTFDSAKVLYTPRRVVVYVEGILTYQIDQHEIKKGPAKKACFDSDKKPSKALTGFLSSTGCGMNDLYFDFVKDTEYSFVNKTIKGMKTEDIIESLCNEFLNSVNIPRSMKWGGNTFRFIRPIRWILVIFGDKVIKTSFAGLDSANKSRGHRFLGDRVFDVTNTEEYFSKLRENFVVLDQDERKKLVLENCIELAKSRDLSVDFDIDLVEEITNLVEYPTPLIGSFDKEYLDLPSELIITPMKEHQRYIPLYKEGTLINNFISIRNGSSDFLDNVVKGNEKVLRARLEDAKFFYYEDLKTPLDYRLEALDKIVHMDGIGSYKDKTLRLIEGAKGLASLLKCNISIKTLERTCELSKCDMATNVVYEFPELSGTMGYYYALYHNENKDVAEAIKLHYHPKTYRDSVPDNLYATLLGIIDRLDNILACFILGMIPSGSQDPFALRRQAMCIVKIIKSSGFDFKFSDIIDVMFDLYDKEFDREKIKNEIINFFSQRLSSILVEEGVSIEAVNTQLSSELNLCDFIEKAMAVDSFYLSTSDDMRQSLSRPIRISEDFDELNYDPQMFVQSEETNLHQLIQDITPDLNELYLSKNYESYLAKLTILKDCIDNYFDKVMVNHEDEDLKRNRRGFVKSISLLILKVGFIK